MMSHTARVRGARVIAALLATVALAAGVGAQPAQDECTARLERARRQYQDQQFAEVERLVMECVDRHALPAAQMDDGFRLLTLAYLRENLLAEAQATVVKHLAWSFTYEPDEVRDPPLYVALFRVIRAQLTVPPTALIASSTPTGAPAQPPPADPGPQVVPADSGPATIEETAAAPGGPHDGVGLTDGHAGTSTTRFAGGMEAVPGTTPVEDLTQRSEITSGEPLDFASVMPEIVGGQEAIRLQYPAYERLAGIEGRVVIKFVVGADGKVSDVEVLRSAGAGLDQAAMDAFNRLEFIPGRQNGQPVAVRTTLTFHFSVGGADR
jgi:TonB family protein